VRQGKVFDIEIEGSDVGQAEALLKQAADKLLANTVIENYRVEVTGNESRGRRIPRNQSRARHGAYLAPRVGS
jgi:hypothetical protein